MTDRTSLTNRQIERLLADVEPGPVRDVLLGAIAGERPDADPFTRESPPSRRRPRRAGVVTYRVRIDLAHARRPMWRRLEVDSDLFLDEVHDIIQATFGWWDYHLHRFGSGREFHSHDTEYYLCSFEVEEGETPGVPEDEVRLDEVLVDVGDKLLYTYDFGDDWHLIIKLEAVTPRDGSAPRATCTAGRRPAPHEDCGGVHGYELIDAATDPTSPDATSAMLEYAGMFGPAGDPASHQPTPFDLDEINGALATLEVDAVRPVTNLSEPLRELAEAVRDNRLRRRLRGLLGRAGLDEPVDVDAGTAARMVHPYAWLLDRVGADGIRLTGAGYLPPAHVEAAMTELGLTTEWIGKHNREVQTLPVLHLRESAQKMGLLRKHRGFLVLTPRGRALPTHPVGLWRHLAAHMPVTSTNTYEVQAGRLFLVAVAAEVNHPEGLVADMLDAIGWRNSDGTPVTGAMAGHASFATRTVLRRLGGLATDGRVDATEATSEGIAFARAALQT